MSNESTSETSKILSRIVQIDPEISVAILSRDYQDLHMSTKSTRQVLHTCSHDQRFEKDVQILNQSKQFGELFKSNVKTENLDLTYKEKVYRCVTNDPERTHLIADYHNYSAFKNLSCFESYFKNRFLGHQFLKSLYIFLEYCRLYIVVVFTKSEDRCLSASQTAYHLARFLENF